MRKKRITSEQELTKIVEEILAPESVSRNILDIIGKSLEHRPRPRYRHVQIPGSFVPEDKIVDELRVMMELGLAEDAGGYWLTNKAIRTYKLIRRGENYK